MKRVSSWDMDTWLEIKILYIDACILHKATSQRKDIHPTIISTSKRK